MAGRYRDQNILRRTGRNRQDPGDQATVFETNRNHTNRDSGHQANTGRAHSAARADDGNRQRKRGSPGGLVPPPAAPARPPTWSCPRRRRHRWRRGRYAQGATRQWWRRDGTAGMRGLRSHHPRREGPHSMLGSTRSGGLWLSRKVRMLMITFSPISTRPSIVAEPICGSSVTLPALASRTSFGLTAGSCS